MIVPDIVIVVFGPQTKRSEGRSYHLLEDSTTIEGWKREKIEKSNTDREKSSKDQIYLEWYRLLKERIDPLTCRYRATEREHSLTPLTIIRRSDDTRSDRPE